VQTASPVTPPRTKAEKVMTTARSGRLVRSLLLFALCGLLFAAGARQSPAPAAALDAVPLAAVTWPPSSGLLMSEVVTGGTSASDEFIEIYNAADVAIDLGGLELVYVTSTGSTVTKKQSWTSLSVPSHRHLLVANSSGRWATGADGLYSGGLSATGGSVVLRTTAGAVVDSLSWGDASSTFVEGSPGVSPPASSSLERKPGGAAGNATDSNTNSADSTWTMVGFAVAPTAPCSIA
jgi:predicted extracellular nuclease